jgi:acyl carrier protein
MQNEFLMLGRCSVTKIPTVVTVTILDRVRSFVTTNFYVPDPASLKDDASLIDAGIVDSTGVMEIVQFMESELGLKVADAEIVPENVDSISRIVAFAERKLGIS